MAACFVSSLLEKVIGRNMPTILNIFSTYGASSWPGYRFVVLDDKVENCSLVIEHRRSFALERKILSQLNVCDCILMFGWHNISYNSRTCVTVKCYLTKLGEMS